MTLASLKKRAPSVKRNTITIDEFIDDAELYSRGLSKVVCLPGVPPKLDSLDETLKRATFTLGERAIHQLNHLSQVTGIAKSRLIRIWLDNETIDPKLIQYFNSKTK